MKISTVVLTKNEENNIIDCLESILWCDEVIIIDDYSLDRTLEIIKSLNNDKIKIYERKLNDDFSKQRNFGLSKAKNGWVLFVDADERVPEALASEITNYKLQIINKYNGYYIKRRDFMWGRELKHGEAGNIKLLRLARKNAGKWKGKVHEEWEIKGRSGKLKNPLLHYPHQAIPEFLEEINFYTGLRARELYMSGEQAYWASIILYPIGKFILNYFLKLGFLDGISGLIFAIIMSFHSFLVRGKLWLLWSRKKLL